MAFRVLQHKSCGVPELVTKIPIALDAFDVEANIPAQCRHCAEREAHGIRAIGFYAGGKIIARALGDACCHLWLSEICGALLDQRFQIDAVDKVERVEAVALCFRHLVAQGITHQAMDIDLSKWHFIGKVQRHHDHARHPEEDDVVPGDEYIRGVIQTHLRGVFRPAECAKGPQC